jgi:hypothetical protein
LEEKGDTPEAKPVSGCHHSDYQKAGGTKPAKFNREIIQKNASIINNCSALNNFSV